MRVDNSTVGVRPKGYARFGVTNFTMNKAVALIFAASILFLVGCSTTDKHTDAKWEYRWAYDLQTVQSLKEQGWTLDGFVPSDLNDSAAYYILKRRVQ